MFHKLIKVWLDQFFYFNMNQSVFRQAYSTWSEVKVPASSGSTRAHLRAYAFSIAWSHTPAYKHHGRRLLVLWSRIPPIFPKECSSRAWTRLQGCIHCGGPMSCRQVRGQQQRGDLFRAPQQLQILDISKHNSFLLSPPS